MTNSPEVLTDWQPPKRPEWVAKVNDVGRALDINSIVPLDAEELIDTVVKKTGLSDFGTDDWREPFEVLVKSLEQEADLNLIGRIMTRGGLLNTLESRLKIEDTYRQHPEIDNEIIKEPLIVIGAARSGTSALLNVLASDPENQATKVWESWIPCPPPEMATYDTDPRIEQADKMAMIWNDVTPEFATQHEVRGNIPTEDNFFHELAFRSGLMAWYGKTPSYLQWFATCDMRPAQDYFKRVLKLLQWKHKRTRWILKSPAFSIPLNLILETFPDAKIVYCHRDPAKIALSGESIVNTVHWMRSDNYQAHQGLFKAVTSDEMIVAATNANIDLLESGSIPDKQIYHLRYADFIQGSKQAMQKIYHYFDIPFSESSQAAVTNYVEENIKERQAQGKHNYTKPSPARIANVRKLFKRYQDYFDVPNEI